MKGHRLPRDQWAAGQDRSACRYADAAIRKLVFLVAAWTSGSLR